VLVQSADVPSWRKSRSVDGSSVNHFPHAATRVFFNRIGRLQPFNAGSTFTEIVSVSIADHARWPNALRFIINRMISRQTLYSVRSSKPFRVNYESIASNIHTPP
jgi:hypothetical protein